MPFDPISWTIIGTIVGLFAVSFMDEIREWATRALEKIRNAIDRSVEVTSDAIVSIVKEGYRYYKKIKVYVMNIRTDVTKTITTTQESSNPPEEIKTKLAKEKEEKLLRYSV